MLITTEPLAVTSKQHLLELLAQPPFDQNRCWEWQNFKHNGYGRVWYQDKGHYTHRLAYTLAYGEIPTELVVHHTCYNRACCNPAHLKARTILENIWDKNSACPSAPHNRPTACPKCGSTDRGTIKKSNGNSQTYCRPCQRQAARKHYRNHIQPLDREDKKELYERYRDANRTASREWARRNSGYYKRRGLEAPPLKQRGRPRKLPIGDASTAEMNSAAPRPFEANDPNNNSQ